MDTLTFLEYIGMASLCGGIIGLERQYLNKSAGLRTNTLVTLGATIYVLLSLEMTAETGGDPTRIVGQVVTGIGFLGAGVIMHQGANVIGLTTAATVWCSSAVGCLIGAGYFKEALIFSVVIVLLHFILRKIDGFIDHRSPKT